MKLLHLQAHNVFSIGDVELDLKDRGLLLVTGWSYDDSNGNAAGKSSVARNAVMWCMYGKTVDGVKADAVINTSIKNAKHCGVTLHFEGIDGKEYRIYRSRKPNSLVLSRKLTTDEGEEWEELTKRLEKDTQEIIDVLLGRDHKTFIQSDFFGQGRERSFLALPGSEQRAVIEEILPLSSLESWHAGASEGKKKAQAKVDEARASLRAQHERSQMALTHYEGLKSQGTTWSTNKTVDLSTLQHNLNKIQLMSSGLEHEITSLTQSLPTNMTVRELLEGYRLEERSILSEQTTLGCKIDTLTGNIDAKACRPDVCASCDQPLPIERIKLNDAALEADKETRDRLTKQRGQNEAALYHYQAQAGICGEILQLRDRITTKGQEESVKDRITALKATTNPFLTLTAAAHTELEKERHVYETYSTVVEEEEKMRDHYYFWDKAFGKDLKTMLFDQVCPYLQAKTNKYLADLNNGQIKVGFSVVKEMKSGDTKDQFSVTASSSTGSETFELFSGAEKQLTSFAVGMALSDLAGLQTQGKSRFMILDEPFLYQSPENCENIVNFLTTHKVGDESTLLLISNEDNLVNLIPNRVHVVKRKGVSSIE